MMLIVSDAGVEGSEIAQRWCYPVGYLVRLRLKCDGTRAPGKLALYMFHSWDSMESQLKGQYGVGKQINWTALPLGCGCHAHECECQCVPATPIWHKER
jgi:hypothetical protein